MAYERKDNTGSLFPNKFKEEDKHPDYTGELMIEGKLYEQAGWINTDKNGKKYMSFAYNKPKSKTTETRDYESTSTDYATIPF